MLYNIEQMHSPNFEDRQGQVPIIIVLHDTDGAEAVRSSDQMEESAVDNTFLSPSSQCSSHHGITRDGRIKEYVPIDKCAWTQGLHGHDEILLSTSPIVRQMDINPNLYCVSIEYLAYGKDHGGDGSITEDQFYCGCWLIKYYQEQVQKMYGHKIPLNNSYIMGHKNIDPVYRPHDPGDAFPWSRLFAELAVADGMTLEDYEGRIQYLRSDKAQKQQAFAIANEALYLYTLSKGTDGEAGWAKSVLLRLYPVMTSVGLLSKPYDENTSHADVANECLYLYDLSLKEDGDGIWARQQLVKMYPFMLSNGLV